MGIVARQSTLNVLTICLGFLVGAINTLYLYPNYPGKAFQGLIVSLLAISNLIQPYLSFGLQHMLIKFYGSYEQKADRDSLLWFSIYFPLLIIGFIAVFLAHSFEPLFQSFFEKNSEMARYSFLIFLIAIATAYFEIFFSWLRVQLQSVFGNFLKEFYPRFLIFSLLVLYAFGVIDFDSFVIAIIIGYYFRLLIIAVYSFWVYTPSFRFSLPVNLRKILHYSFLIFLSGTAASLILDIDKSMLPRWLSTTQVAYYTVAVFMASTIEIPGRAMFQIMSPLVAKRIHEKDRKGLRDLFKKSSSNLLLVSGFIFLVLICNVSEIYTVINLEDYEVATGVVWVIAFGKLFSMSLGCINQIIGNSEYYQYVFWFSVGAAILAVFLNIVFIQSQGILGAAYATLIVMVVINCCKLILIWRVYGMMPYSLKTVLMLLVLATIYGLIYLLPLAFAPIINVLLKSGLIFLLLLVAIVKGRLSSEMEEMYGYVKNRFLKRRNI